MLRETIARVGAKVGLRVDARDVLDPNGKTKRAFRGEVVGRFRRTGPNGWDDYVYEREDGRPVDVLPGIKVQVEPTGAAVRMRRRGAVVVVRWAPTEAESAGLDENDEGRAVFLERYIDVFGETAGKGAAAFIASKLRR